MTWLAAERGVLAFSRPGLCCVVNISARPAELPAHQQVLTAGAPLRDGKLEPDGAC